MTDKMPTLRSKEIGPNRRRFLIGTAAAASAASWPLILTPGKAKASERIVVPSWGGAYAETITEAFYKPFEKMTGIPVIVGPQPDLAKIKAMVKTGNVEYDLVDTITGWIVEGENEGLWEPINLGIVNRANVAPHANRPMVQGFYLAGGGIVYNEKSHGAADKHPKSWPEFWDVKSFPGRRGLRADRVAEILELAVMADGVAPKDVYPIDVERAFKSLNRIKPHITHWISATAQTIALVEQGECDFTYSYNSRVFASRKAGKPVQFVFNQVFAQTGYTAVVKGSKNKDAAMRLIAYYLDPQAQARWAVLYGLAGTNSECMKYIPEDVKKSMVDMTSPSNCIENIEYWGTRNAELLQRYKEWLLT